MEVQTEVASTGVLTLEEVQEILGVSDRTIRDWRKQIEPIVSKRIATYRRHGNTRKLVFPVDSVAILEAWRDRVDDDSFASAYGKSSQYVAQEDWSDIAEDVDPADVEIIESGSESGTIVRIDAQKPVLYNRQNEIQDLIGAIVVNALQLEFNAQQREKAEIEQVKEDAKVRFLRQRAAEQEAAKEMAESLDRASKAAREAVGKKGGKRAAKSF